MQPHRSLPDMPRVSRAQTEKNRAAIEHASSRLIRERGLSVSVADLMGSVGLTPGGFYGHFKSKDDLNAVACDHAFTEAARQWQIRMASAGSRTTLINAYLHPRAASAKTPCPMVSLAADVAREDTDKPVRQRFHQGLEELVRRLQTTYHAEHARDAALADVATMVGALLLARATRGKRISREIMAASRARLLGDGTHSQG